MYTIAQIQAGAARYIDNDLAPSFNGLDKYLIPGFATMIVLNLPRTAARYHDHPLAIAAGIFDENGDVDIDTVYKVLRDLIGTDKIPVNLPKNIRLHLGRSDLDNLYNYIKEA